MLSATVQPVQILFIYLYLLYLATYCTRTCARVLVSGGGVRPLSVKGEGGGTVEGGRGGKFRKSRRLKISAPAAQNRKKRQFSGKTPF